MAGLLENIRNMNIVKEMTYHTFLVAMFGSLGGMGFGIDYGYWSGMLGIEQFIKDFGVFDPQTGTYKIPSTWQSAGSADPVAGLAFGALVSGIIGNHLGRLNTFRVASAISVIGILIQSTAISSYWQITVGRIINALALGIIANTVPAYLAEVSPLSIRGTVVNCYQFSIGVGALIVSVANWGMYLRSDQWAYRLVLILQFMVPMVFVPGSFLIVESPRWLLGKGREEEAMRALQYLRTGTSQDLLDREVQLIAAAEEENRAHFANSWKECFVGSNLRRTMIATGVQCWQQAQGSSFMGSYQVVFFQALGVPDVYRISILISLTMVIASIFAFYIPDRFGRRWILFSSSLIMAACICIVGGVKGVANLQSASATNAAIACLFIWQLFTSVGWSSCVWMVTAETPTLQLREKTITIATFTGFCVSIIVSFVSPYIQDEGYGGLGGKISFLYGGLSVVSALWVFFFLPETGFRSLEELDELFHEEVSVFKFRKYVSSGYGAQLTEAEEAARYDGVLDAKEASVEVESQRSVSKN